MKKGKSAKKKGVNCSTCFSLKHVMYFLKYDGCIPKAIINPALQLKLGRRDFFPLKKSNRQDNNIFFESTTFFLKIVRSVQFQQSELMFSALIPPIVLRPPLIEPLQVIGNGI